jgi:hypothetical protein
MPVAVGCGRHQRGGRHAAADQSRESIQVCVTRDALPSLFAYPSKKSMVKRKATHHLMAIGQVIRAAQALELNTSRSNRWTIRPIVKARDRRYPGWSHALRFWL